MKLIELLIKSLIVCLLAFYITSCSDDDVEYCDNCGFIQFEEPVISLVGSWQMTSLITGNLDYSLVKRQLVRKEYIGVGKDFTYSITFNDNPKTYFTSGGYTIDLQTDSAGLTFNREIKVIDIQRNGFWKWDPDGNSIQLKDSIRWYREAINLIVINDSTFHYGLKGFKGTSMGKLGPTPIDTGTIGFKRL